MKEMMRFVELFAQFRLVEYRRMPELPKQQVTLYFIEQ
jgi:hypothetical protein